MLGEFRATWKWAVPGFFFILTLWCAIVMPMEWKGGRLLAWMVAGLCLVMTLTNWWRLMSREAVENFKMRREAEAITAQGQMIEAGKGVHPETLRLILGERARRWGLVSGTKSPTGEPYKFLASRPRVTEAFLIYFLRNSDGKNRQYMPKHGKLSEGDTSWDPERITSAYEIYNDLVSLLEEELKCTRPFGLTKPGYWLGEWDARSVGLDFGVDIEEWEDGTDESEEEAGSTVQTGNKYEDGVDTSNLHRASAREFERLGVNPIQAQSMEGLLQTPAMLAKLKSTKA